VEKGGVAMMNVLFCSNPPPSKAIWEWGSLQLEAGYPMGRFKADKVQKVSYYLLTFFLRRKENGLQDVEKLWKFIAHLISNEGGVV